MRKITIDMTDEELAIFEDMVSTYCDSGPIGQGYNSNEALRLIAKIECLIEEEKQNEWRNVINT
jgi:hypothetical protein